MSTMFECPCCGARLAVVYGENELLGYDRPATWDYQEPVRDRVQALGAMMRQPSSESVYQTYKRGPGAATAAWKEVSFEQPARAASVQSDFQVPLLQAVMSGLFVGAAVVVGGVWLAVSNEWAWYVPPAAGALAWLITSGVMWSNLLKDSRSLLRRVERYVGNDDVSPPVRELETVSVRVQTTEKGHTTMDHIEHWPETREVLEAFTTGRIKRISRREVRALLRVSQGKAEKILEDLRGGDYIHYPNGETGASELTARGRALARKG